MLKLIEETQNKYVTPSEMDYGELGVIRKWLDTDNDLTGGIIMHNGAGWHVIGTATFFRAGLDNPEFYQIEILPKGTKFEIV